MCFKEKTKKIVRAFLRPIIHLFGYIETSRSLKQNRFNNDQEFAYLQKYFNNLLEMRNRDLMKKDQRSYEHNEPNQTPNKEHIDYNLYSKRHKEKNKKENIEHKVNKKTSKADIKERSGYKNEQTKEIDTYLDYFDPLEYKKEVQLDISPPFCATVEFGNLKFLSTFKSYHFEVFMKFTIARIGHHFYPDKKIKAKNIDLEHYQDFKFSVKYLDNLYILINDNDFLAALIFSNGRIDIVINRDEVEDVNETVNSQ